MRIVAHKNDYKGMINVPVIMIAESVIETAEEILSRISPELEPIILNTEQVPDQKYIKAFAINNQKLEIDIVKARDVFRRRVRMGRIQKLQELDVAFQRALETGSDTTQIVAQKQRLRDAPDNPLIEQAQTTAELDALFDPLVNGEI